MLGVFAKGSTSLFALGIAAIAGLVRRCREMREKLEKSGDDLKTLEEKMTALCTSNEEMRKQRDEAETHFFDQLRKLKQEFEDEWSLREKEWQTKLSTKEDDAHQRLEEISSWQTELARLRSEAIAIRSAIEKVRSRSTSPGRSEVETEISLSESITFSEDQSRRENKENRAEPMGAPGKAGANPTNPAARDPLNYLNGGSSPLRA